MWKYFLIGIGLMIWLVFGEPKTDIANLVWGETPAPWEAVDGVFYPARADLSQYVKVDGFRDLEACRQWVDGQARIHGDPSILLGDYECAFGTVRGYPGLEAYRQTAR